MVEKGRKFPLLVVSMAFGVFVLGSLAGAFIYATGSNVLDSTYMQMISHTEYRYSEPGQIIARLVDFQGDPISVVNCTANIKYPDKTAFVTDGLMSTSSITGDHYYNFTTSNGPEGVYEYQATCFYMVGANTRNQSVTNSFHLSSAFTNVLNNLSQLSTDLLSVNVSLSQDIADLSTQLNENVTQILAAINNITIDVNLTPVLDAIDQLNSTVNAQYSVITSNQQQINATVNNINSTVNAMSVVIDAVNMTTVNTYDYITGTLTAKVDQALMTLGVINATVNRIETNTLDINSTVNTILENQQNAVQMTVFSG